MTLWRAGAILHYSRSTTEQPLCGANDTTLETRSNRDDLLCGLCQSLLSNSVSSDFWLVKPGGLRTDYKSYILSQHWEHVRELALEHYGEACALCGGHDRINVHHRSYDRLGHEHLSDLTVLCQGCHETYHDKAA